MDDHRIQPKTKDEVRSFSDDLRVDAELGTFEGHASVFWAVDSYGTVFSKGAFRKTLTEQVGKIPVLFLHDPAEMVGPTLELKEDKVGLFHRSKAVEDGRTGSYVLSHLRGGTPLGMSFAFRTMKDRAGEESDPIDLTSAHLADVDGITTDDVRVITEVRLREITVLPFTFAANPKTDIMNVRSDLEIQALNSLLEVIRQDGLDEPRRAVLRELVAAYEDRAEPDANTRALTREPEPTSRTRRDIDLATAIARWGHLGVVV